ncbi:MAG: hypothetical protein CL878_01070 [Dehalococcoidia bacterium]|nr:hypothetical protein [Dehalococcoidia bacterium]
MAFALSDREGLSTMKFTVGVNVGGPHYDPAHIGAIARKADEVGLHSVGAAERLIMPRVIKSRYPRGSGAVPGVGSAQNTLEVLSVIGFLAGQTSRIRLMPFVVMPYRNPLLAAKMLATIDVLSNGRLDILLGVGWNREEARALMVPTPFDKRGAVTNEYLRAFVELWNQEHPEFQGNYLQISDVDFAPKPVQRPHPPFWIGGESPAAIRRAARLGDGWSPGSANPQFPLDTTEQFTSAVASLRRRAEAAGRDPHSIAIRFGSVTWSGGQAETGPNGERMPFTGSAEQIAEDVRALAKLGVTHMSVSTPAESLAQELELLESFATEVIPLACA